MDKPAPHRTDGAGLATRVHYVCLPIAFVGLLWFTRDQYFSEDDWEFIHRLIPGAGHLGLFAPHNEHWSTLPLLVYRVLFALAGVRTYLPYMAVLLALHVLIAHILWRLMRGAGAEAWVATAVSALFLVLGTGADNISWAFQIGWVGALAPGLGMVLLALRRSRRRLAAAWLLGVVSLMCSGLGPIMVAIAGLTALMRVGMRWAVLVVSVPAVVYSGWLIAFGLRAPRSSLPRGSVTALPDYVFTGITSAAAAITGLRAAGALLLIPLAWWLVRRARRRGEDAAVASMAAGALLFFLVVGVGRVGLGVRESTSARYVYVAAVLLLPAAAVALSRLTRRHVVAAAVVALAVAWSAIHNIRALNLIVQASAVVRDHAEARIIVASHLVDTTATTFGGLPEPGTAPDLTWPDLVYLVHMHDLPLAGPVPPDGQDVVTVAANLQMTWSAVPLLAPGATSISGVGSETLTPVASGCVAVTGTTPVVMLDFTRAASVVIRAPAGRAITVELRLTPSASDESPAQHVATGASGTISLNVSLAGAAAVVDVPPSGAVFCGVAAT